MGRIILGFILAGVGFVMVWKASWFYENFGALSLGEKFAMWGGTRMIYKMIGLIFIFIGFSLIVNLWGTIARFILSPYLRIIQ